MNFDYTFIRFFGFTFFEPLAILTNVSFFFICLYFFFKLKKYTHDYSTQMRWFLLLLGTGSFFGAIAHGVHYQLGMNFFKTIYFLMNSVSLLSFFYCFRAPYTYYKLNRTPSKRYIYLVGAWLLILAAISFSGENFLLIKIHAGIALFYSFLVHLLVYRRNSEKGSALIVLGISISFLSIVVHSLKLSLHEWFNYKDFAHVIILCSIFFIYRGIKLNLIGIETQNVD